MQKRIQHVPARYPLQRIAEAHAAAEAGTVLVRRTRGPAPRGAHMFVVLLVAILGCASRTPVPEPPTEPTSQAPQLLEPPAMPSSDSPVAPSTEGADLLTYRFQDASVPPPYHRSYSLTATRDTIARVVDSYGDEIERQEAPLTAERLRALLATLEGSVARRPVPLDNPGCTGGTGESITVSRGGEALFHASVYHCGGQDGGDLVGDAGALRDAMLALLPAAP